MLIYINLITVAFLVIVAFYHIINYIKSKNEHTFLYIAIALFFVSMHIFTRTFFDISIIRRFLLSISGFFSVLFVVFWMNKTLHYNKIMNIVNVVSVYLALSSFLFTILYLVISNIILIEKLINIMFVLSNILIIATTLIRLFDKNNKPYETIGIIAFILIGVNAITSSVFLLYNTPISFLIGGNYILSLPVGFLFSYSQIGYVSNKIIDKENEINNIRLIDNNDDFYLSFNKMCDKYFLSELDRNILQSIVSGKYYKEIAPYYGFTIRTFQRKVKKIFSIIDVENQKELLLKIKSI